MFLPLGAAGESKDRSENCRKSVILITTRERERKRENFLNLK